MTGITLLIFPLFDAIPGDPARMRLGMRPNVTTIEMPREQWGSDNPLIVQYWMFWKRAAAGDLGRSTNDNRLVLETILERAPATALLALTSMLFSIVIGLPAGILAAVRRNTWLDCSSMLATLAGISIPIFFLAILLAWIFADELRWFPVTGDIDQRGWMALALPSVALRTRPMAILVAVLGLNLLGDGLRDFLDPHLQDEWEGAQ
ncbi:MAG: ABC transporter permease [bacterium]